MPATANRARPVSQVCASRSVRVARRAVLAIQMFASRPAAPAGDRMPTAAVSMSARTCAGWNGRATRSWATAHPCKFRNAGAEICAPQANVIPMRVARPGSPRATAFRAAFATRIQAAVPIIAPRMAWFAAPARNVTSAAQWGRFAFGIRVPATRGPAAAGCGAMTLAAVTPFAALRVRRWATSVRWVAGVASFRGTTNGAPVPGSDVRHEQLR